MIPKKYRNTGSPNILTVDYFDFTRTTGYKRFYAQVTAQGDSLSPNVAESNTFFTTGFGAPLFTKNFDMTFSTPSVIYGRAFFAATYGGTCSNGGVTSMSTYCKVTLQKVDLASATTDIGAEITTDTLSLNAQTVTKRASVYWDVALTKFKVGEKLRLVVKFYSSQGNPIAGTAYIYHDPANRKGTGYPQTEYFINAQPDSTMTLDIPFRIQQ